MKSILVLLNNWLERLFGLTSFLTKMMKWNFRELFRVLSRLLNFARKFITWNRIVIRLRITRCFNARKFRTLVILLSMMPSRFKTISKERFCQYLSLRIMSRNLLERRILQFKINHYWRIFFYILWPIYRVSEGFRTKKQNPKDFPKCRKRPGRHLSRLIGTKGI